MWQVREVDGAACSQEPPTRDGFDGSLDSRVRAWCGASMAMGARELYACTPGFVDGGSGVLGRCWVLVVLVTSALCFN